MRALRIAAAGNGDRAPATRPLEEPPAAFGRRVPALAGTPPYDT